jgi:membrane-anchored mycosin MYCP
MAGTLALALAGVPVAAPARAAEEPPALPANGDGSCAGPSPVTVTAKSWPQSRMAPHLVSSLTGGGGTVVAVVDTGVSGRAPALAGAVRPGLDVVSGGPAGTDCLGRGTALAGIIAARPLAGTEMAGMAPQATILPVRVVDTGARVSPEALAEGIGFAVQQKAPVILVGTGVTEDSPGLRAAVRAAADANSLIVAGFAGTDPQSAVSYPAGYPQVLSVTDSGAVPGADLSVPVDGAYSLGPAGSGHYRVGGPAVAAAYVAGTAALLRTYRPQLHWTQVRDRLVSTAEPPAAGTAGAGILDPYAAVAGLSTRRPAAAAPAGAAVTLPLPPPGDPAVRAAGIAGSVLLAVAAGLAALVVTVRSARRRRP